MKSDKNLIVTYNSPAERCLRWDHHPAPDRAALATAPGGSALGSQQTV